MEPWRDDLQLSCRTNGSAMNPELRPVPSLDTIAADPSLATSVPPPARLPLYFRALAVLNALAPLIAAPSTTPAGAQEEDCLLTVNEAAVKLGLTSDWLYRRAKTLPFTVRPSPGKVRFSLRGIEKYIRHRQGR
jgi:predicted DNA-binding transcriptional regulator AlpA